MSFNFLNLGDNLEFLYSIQNKLSQVSIFHITIRLSQSNIRGSVTSASFPTGFD